MGNCYYSPEIVYLLKWTPIRQISAGGSHSAILSYTGCIYLWGKNDFGQLGLNDMVSRNVPILQRSLRDQKIAFISLGEEHSAALTCEGGLFTWGAGMYGQLGHGKNSNEIMPRKIFELMGVPINQLSCGRCHTLVASKRGRVYSFGLNGSGQLGIGSTQLKYLPTEVRGSWVETDIHDLLLRNKDSALFPLNTKARSCNLSVEFAPSERTTVRKNGLVIFFLSFRRVMCNFQINFSKQSVPKEKFPVLLKWRLMK